MQLGHMYFLNKESKLEGKDSIPLQQCAILQAKKNTDVKSTDNFQSSSI